MVSTRSHPRGDFPAFEPSPTKRSTRTSTASPAPTTPPMDSSPSKSSLARRAVSNTIAAASPPSPEEIDEPGWCHTASNLTIFWIAVSLPLVLWDCLYILLRPHTMEGGAIQWPIWKPYEIYAAVDHVYGWPGWNEKDGFGGAQAVLNSVETVLYGLYAMIVYNHGIPTWKGTGFQISSEGVGKWYAGGRKVRGQKGNRALIIGFSAAVMTLSKTIMYYFNEYYSGFAHVGHNDWPTLIWFYVIMNGLWIIFPAYMTIVFGSDILTALDIAAEETSKKE